MAELNAAYSSGDQVRLNQLVNDYRNSPDLVSGETIGDEWTRAIRQIYQIKARFAALDAEEAEAEASELYGLRLKVEAEMAEGRDLLAQMAARTSVHIRKSQRRLENLKNVNQAQEEYVKRSLEWISTISVVNRRVKTFLLDTVFRLWKIEVIPHSFASQPKFFNNNGFREPYTPCVRREKEGDGVGDVALAFLNSVSDSKT
ncbi:MAG: hypothetical protein IPO41_16695 [Acidobacteria bacterium]|nr:hypothetical protein [Acidobacteriota bacterium]